MCGVRVDSNTQLDLSTSDVGDPEVRLRLVADRRREVGELVGVVRVALVGVDRALLVLAVAPLPAPSAAAVQERDAQDAHDGSDCGRRS